MELGKENFCKIVTTLKKYEVTLEKLEDALGGMILEPLAEVETSIYDVLESCSNKIWSDEVWDSIFDTEVSAEGIWNLIQECE